MKKPCVAVDVSKSKSHYQGWINVDKKCGNAKCIEHSKIGFQEISNKLKELEGITNEKPVVVFESTGVYHRSLQQYLEDNEIIQLEKDNVIIMDKDLNPIEKEIIEILARHGASYISDKSVIQNDGNFTIISTYKKTENIWTQ